MGNQRFPGRHSRREVRKEKKRNGIKPNSRMKIFGIQDRVYHFFFISKNNNRKSIQKVG
jgi:hypothetical protein